LTVDLDHNLLLAMFDAPLGTPLHAAALHRKMTYETRQAIEEACRTFGGSLWDLWCRVGDSYAVIGAINYEWRLSDYPPLYRYSFRSARIEEVVLISIGVWLARCTDAVWRTDAEFEEAYGMTLRQHLQERVAVVAHDVDAIVRAMHNPVVRAKVHVVVGDAVQEIEKAGPFGIDPCNWQYPPEQVFLATLSHNSV
jgi:hypothetical protein